MVYQESVLEAFEYPSLVIQPISMFHRDRTIFVSPAQYLTHALKANHRQGGPCPGLNSAANHTFIPHDGIVTFNELVDAQQNIWNVEYFAAIVVTAYTISATDGDPITQKLSKAATPQAAHPSTPS